jgi:predicted GIY-YIG superfamily endonuclease
MSAPPEELVPGQSVAVYRFYDRHEELLYVGISNDPRRRWKQHAKEKTWYPQVRHQTVTWYDSERAARRAESAAIRQERPHFNIAGAIRPPRARFAFQLRTIVTVAALWLYAGPALSSLPVGFPVLKPVVVPCAEIAFLTSVPVGLIMLAAVAGPFLRRSGAWLERNTVHSVKRAQS